LYDRYTAMLLTGDLVIHKTDNATRDCRAVVVLKDGSIAVWDSLPDNDWAWDTKAQDIVGNFGEKSRWEPDIIAGPDMYERVERKGHPWKFHTPAGLRQLAEERDDVDEDELPDRI